MFNTATLLILHNDIACQVIGTYVFVISSVYSLFITSAGFCRAACHTRQPILMVITIAIPAKIRMNGVAPILT